MEELVLIKSEICDLSSLDSGWRIPYSICRGIKHSPQIFSRTNFCFIYDLLNDAVGSSEYTGIATDGLERRGREALVDIPFKRSLDETMKFAKQFSIRISGVPAEIRTSHFPNTGHKCYSQ
jgi:hypothetical protein